MGHRAIPGLANRQSESRLVEDLYVGSMSVVEIVMALNETFGIELPEAVVSGWRTVGHICCSVQRSMKASIE